ncbi:LLM class flavin-dependent oxidoreductase [Myxococcota bacterium]|nr:LLM class flavin-dependent oxidoreductase [Myxococcota bacterium]
MSRVKVGMRAPAQSLIGPVADRRAALAALADAGLDHVGVSDHVSFFVGAGFDGLIQAAQLTTLHDTLPVMVAVYLLPLRHPTTVARQLQCISAGAPGRLVFGIGVGGEDPHEYEVCGIDPRTRGARANESLEILRGLMTGEPIDFEGVHYSLSAAQIAPAVEPAVPILVGGRSAAAVRRTARFGDGYLGVWISPGRFAAIAAEIAEQAEGLGRRPSDVCDHGMYVWCGFGDTREQARQRVSEGMQDIYRIGFENFERYTPYGSPEEVAEFLAPYAEAGCRNFHLVPVAGNDTEAVEQAAEVKRLLASNG